MKNRGIKKEDLIRCGFTLKCFTTAIFLLFFLVYSALGYVMKSDNYRMQSDSLNTGGGSGSSINYIFEDTVGEIATGPSASASYKMKAGYQQMQEVFLSVSSPADVIMTPTIAGISGGLASGEAAWTVITDGPSGFNMKINASTDPAMQMDVTYNFSDYSPAVLGSPDFLWGAPGAGVAEFGFSVEPKTADDTDTLFRDDGAECNAGGLNTPDRCWFDFNGMNNIDIINRASRTDNNGEIEIVKFRAESSAKFLKEGNYDAYITVTVSAN
jgi:hypothetical protein